MESLLSTIHAPYAPMGFEELMSVTTKEVIQGSVDAEDDLAREVALYVTSLVSTISSSLPWGYL
jgi:hypothetical protein